MEEGLDSSKNLDNKSKQKKFKRKYHIFANELAGISLRNWKSDILLDIRNAPEFSQIDDLIINMTEFSDTDYDNLFRCNKVKQNNSIVQVEES